MNRVKGLSVGFGIFAVIGLLILLVAFNTYYTVDEGDRGVVLRNGKIVSVSEPGLHFKLPFVEDVKGLCDFHQTKIIILDNEKEVEKSLSEELAEDIISIIHSFSGKMYGLRKTIKDSI